MKPYQDPQTPSSKSPSTHCSRFSETPETVAHTYLAETLAIAAEKIPVVHAEFARKLERERDQARRMWSIYQDKLAELREEVRITIMENLHLADGDVCTLKRLKDTIRFDLRDHPENADVEARREVPPNPSDG